MVFCKSPPSKMFRKISNQILTKAALSSSRCGRQPGGVLKGVSSKHQVNITRKQLKHSDRMSSTSFSALLLVFLRWDRLNCVFVSPLEISELITYHIIFAISESMLVLSSAPPAPWRPSALAQAPVYLPEVIIISFCVSECLQYMVEIFRLVGMTDFDSSAYLGQWYGYSKLFEIYRNVFAGSQQSTSYNFLKWFTLSWGKMCASSIYEGRRHRWGEKWICQSFVSEWM